MELLTSAIESARGFARSTQEFIDGLVCRCDASSRRHPVEILKRLQREAFSDIMKLRDRQDKVEKILSFYKSSKDGPFHEAMTHVRGRIDVSAGALSFNRDDEFYGDALLRAGIRTGMDTQFTFESTVREKDTLVAEFLAAGKGKGEGDVYGEIGTTTLSLAKVMYRANLGDWFSLVAIPFGALCRDVSSSSNIFYQGNGLTDNSCSGPPLLNERNCSAIGLTVQKSNVVASLGQFSSRTWRHLPSNVLYQTFSTFGQIVCHLPRETRFSIVGLHRVHKSSTLGLSPGPLYFPLSHRNRGRDHSSFEESLVPDMGSYRNRIVSEGSISLMLESPVDENTWLGGWMEMNNLNPRCMHWAINLSDDSKDELGWGLSLSGINGSRNGENRFQAESHMKINLGKRFDLRPGIVHVMDGNARITAFMLRSSWSL